MRATSVLIDAMLRVHEIELAARRKNTSPSWVGRNL